jgi:hypothetical protein
MARFSLQNLSKAKQDEFFRTKQKESLKPFERLFEDYPEFEKIQMMVLGATRRRLKREYGPSGRRSYHEFMQDA